MDMNKRLNKVDIHRRRLARMRIAFKWFLTLLLVCMAAGIVVFVVFLNTGDWADFDPDRLENIKQTLVIYDKDDQPVAGMYSENRTIIPVSQVPQHVIDALICTEDTRFYTHPGIDVKRILGSMLANVKAGGNVQGASTITQQLVKNAFLTNEKSWNRKIKEAWLALQLERYYDKDEILEMYLNLVYFGNGAYGIEAAAQSYFGIDASQLTVAQGAQLIGILKGTAIYAPHINMDKSLTRRDLILTLMYKAGKLTQAGMDAAKAEACVLNLSRPNRSNYGYYVDAVTSEALAVTGLEYEDMIATGYRIYTALDAGLQQTCQDLMSDESYFPADAADGTQVQTALVVLDAQTGDVRAVIGGREYESVRGLNRATSARRQPGSAIKPLMVYAPAIESYGYTPLTMINDQPTDFNGYAPQNAGGKYYGWVPLRECLYRSLNNPAVSVFNSIGVNAGKTFCQNVGIPFAEQDDNLSLALGGFTVGVTPLELAQAYTVFPGQGEYAQASFIQRIEDSEGTVIYQNPHTRKQVLSPETAFIVTDMMTDTATIGTGKRLKQAGIPLAAKTGTVAYTTGNRDAWLAAFNSDYVVVSWQGFDRTDAEHFLPAGSTGGNHNALLAVQIFEALYPDGGAPKFTVPGGVTKLAIDKTTLYSEHKLMLAAELTPAEYVLQDYFTRANAPTETAKTWAAPTMATQLSVALGSDSMPVVQFVGPQAYVRYDIYRRDEQGTSMLVQSLTAQSDNQVLSYIDADAPEGLCAYTVVAVNTLMNVSSPPTGEAMVLVPSPTAAFSPDEDTGQPAPAESPDINFWDLFPDSWQQHPAA
ncbi:MAG: PBP1A family penicillin-binding protein [Eubacteriales bacterium]|nr:PBP1A family penicillin-binding protein [Eubacteriales bacterium]